MIGRILHRLTLTGRPMIPSPMFYPVRRDKCREILTEHLAKSRAARAMLERVDASLASYTRKTADKWLANHLKASASVSLHDRSTDYVCSFSLVDLSAQPGEMQVYDEVIYPEKEKEGQTERDTFGLAVLARLEGVKETIRQCENLLATLDQVLDYYEGAAKIVEEVNGLPGMYMLRPEVPHLTTR